MRIEPIINKDITKEENEQLNKLLSEIQISQISPKKYIITRGKKYAIFMYEANSFKEFIASLADFYEANKENGYYGFSKYMIKNYQSQIRQLFTQKEINLFPIIT